MTKTNQCPEGGACAHPDGPRDCQGFEPGRICWHHGSAETAAEKAGIQDPRPLVGQAVHSEIAPLAEEVALRAYLEAMVAAGYELQMVDCAQITVDEAIERLSEAGRKRIGATVNVVKTGGAFLNINGWL